MAGYGRTKVDIILQIESVPMRKDCLVRSCMMTPSLDCQDMHLIQFNVFLLFYGLCTPSLACLH